MSVSIFQIAVFIKQRETEVTKQTIRNGCTYIELVICYGGGTCVHVPAGARGGVRGHPELVLEAVISHPVWVPGTKLRSSKRATKAFDPLSHLSNP